MAVERQNIVKYSGIIFLIMVLLMLFIAARIVFIQVNEGDKYNNLSSEIIEKVDTIYANKGNVYAADGSLLATSMFRYEIRMDVMTVNKDSLQKHLPNLSIALGKMLKQESNYYQKKIEKARNNKNRYLFIAKNLNYPEYRKIRSFPIFNKGAHSGGFIAIQKTVREHPLGKVAARTIGYDDYRGRPGIEGAYHRELRGKNGQRLKQKIAKGQWKPINDDNEIEPENGKDVITTIDVNMQDIAHEALLKQLEYHEAKHGSVVLMEVKTGEIKAIANLGRTEKGTYYEKLNYAIGESHEPGSSFKLMSMVVAMEDKLIDTATVVDTKNGKWKLYNRIIRDSNNEGYGEISVARALEVSSNVAFAKMIHENYKKKPQKFIDGLKDLHLDQPLGLPFKGEGIPVIPNPKDKSWSGTTLAWMSYGYGVQLTPLQTLTFYNAIANKGKMVKPRFIKEIRYQNDDDNTDVFETEVIDKHICSEETALKIKEVLRNAVKNGTAKNIYSPNYSIAGKTGTCQAEYWTDHMYYISSFTGFFPVEEPEYSCIVVIHKPKINGFYGNKVAAPVFKKIAQKVYAATPIVSEVAINSEYVALNSNYNRYHSNAQKTYTTMPNVKGMSGMDAVSLLENLGVYVKFSGTGAVTRQSIKPGSKIVKGNTVYLTMT